MTKKRKSNKQVKSFKTTKSVKSNKIRDIKQDSGLLKEIKHPGFLDQKYRALGIMCFAILLYFMTFSYGYILDDRIFLEENSFVQKGFTGFNDILSKESMAGFFGEQKNLVTGARYRPLSLITFATEVSLFGENPGISHLINVLLYGLTGVLVGYLCVLFWPPRDQQVWYQNIALWSALLFIAHPVHTEVVANIKGRDEILALLLSLTTLILAIRAHKIWHYLLMAVTFYLALLAKENSITFLAVIPVCLYVFSHRHRSVKDWTSLGLALFLAAVVYLAQRYMVIGYVLSSGSEITELMNSPFLQMTTEEKYATISFTFIKYLQLLIWPHPLSHDYYPYAIDIMKWSDVWSLLSVLLHLVGAFYAIIKIRSKSPYAAFILIYLATISIVSNIPFTVGTTMNERFIYMPSLAFVLFVPYLFFNNMDIRPLRLMARRILITLFILGLSVLTLIRLPVWSDYTLLNKSAVEAYPNSARSNLFYGTALYQDAQKIGDHGKKMDMYQTALTYIDKSLTIYPAYSNAHQMKAGIAAAIFHQNQQIHDLFKHFGVVIDQRPSNSYLHEYLTYLNNQGRYRQELLDFYYKMGYEKLCLEQANYSWGIKFLEYGLSLDPNNQRIRQAMADAFTRAGYPQKAAQYQ